jgi:hypothetical protein
MAARAASSSQHYHPSVMLRLLGWFHSCEYAWLHRVSRSTTSEQAKLSVSSKNNFCASHKMHARVMPAHAQLFRFAAAFRSRIL